MRLDRWIARGFREEIGSARGEILLPGTSLFQRIVAVTIILEITRHVSHVRVLRLLSTFRRV